MEEIHKENPRSKKKRFMRALLIFNPDSGDSGESPVQLMDVIGEMQSWKLVPEVYLVEPGSDLPAVVKGALNGGIRMFVVCGGDGTIDLIAGILADTKATLGIIPTGTRNNVAFSLGIPDDIPSAIAIIRTGKRIKVDMGLAVCGKLMQPFLEVCTVGLLSTLFPAADDIQHGDLKRIGDFLSALASSPPADMHLILDGKEEINTKCHVVLVSNMPYIGPHFQVGSEVSMNDGLLDVLLFADLSKIELLGYAVQAVRVGGGLEDERIQHFRVRSLDVETKPAMPVMADGQLLGKKSLQISVKRRVLSVMIGKPDSAGNAVRGVIHEKPR